MTRRGRPRKAGPRNASGRLKRPAAADLRQFTIARELSRPGHSMHTPNGKGRGQ